MVQISVLGQQKTQAQDPMSITTGYFQEEIPADHQTPTSQRLPNPVQVKVPQDPIQILQI